MHYSHSILADDRHAEAIKIETNEFQLFKTANPPNITLRKNSPGLTTLHVSADDPETLLRAVAIVSFLDGFHRARAIFQ